MAENVTIRVGTETAGAEAALSSLDAELRKLTATLRKLNADAKKGADGLDKTNKEVDKLDGGSTRATKDVAKLGAGLVSLAAVTATASAALRGASAAFRAVVGGSIKVGMQFESLETRFEVLLGSADAARERMDLLFEIASSTPFEIQGLAEADALLEAFGADANVWREGVMNLAAVFDMELAEAASAVGRAISGGAGAADILRERGVLAAVELETGLKAAEMSAEEFQEALLRTLTDGRFADGVARLAASMRGLLSNILDAWTRIQKQISDASLFETSKMAADALLDTLKRYKPVIEEITTGIGEGLSSNLRDALLAGAALLDVVELLSAGLSAVQKQFSWVFEALDILGELRGLSSGNPIEMFSSAQAIGGRVAGLITGQEFDTPTAGDLFGDAAEGLGDLAGEILGTESNVQRLLDRFRELDELLASGGAGDGEKGAAGTPGAGGVASAERTFVEIAASVRDYNKAISDAGSGSARSVRSILEAVDKLAPAMDEPISQIEMMRALQQEIVTLINRGGSEVGAMADAYRRLGDAIREAEANQRDLERAQQRAAMLSGTTAAVSAGGQVLSGNVSGVVSQAGPIGALIGAIMDVLTMAGREGASGIRERIASFHDDLVGGLEELPAILGEVIPEAIYRSINDGLAANFADNIGPIIDGLIDTIIAIVEVGLQDAPTVLASLVEDIIAKVPEIVEGLIDGIQGAVEKMVGESSMLGIVFDILSTLIRVLAIELPKVLFLEIVEQIGQLFRGAKSIWERVVEFFREGIVNGLKDMFQRIGEAIRGWLNDATGGLLFSEGGDSERRTVREAIGDAFRGDSKGVDADGPASRGGAVALTVDAERLGFGLAEPLSRARRRGILDVAGTLAPTSSSPQKAGAS